MPARIRPVLVRLVAAALLLALGGCLEYRNVVSVNADGSGEIEVTVVYLPQTVKDLQALAGDHAAAEDALRVFLCDEDQLRLDAKAFGDAVQLKRVETLPPKDGTQGFRAIYTFPDINKVRLGKLVVGRREKPVSTGFPLNEYTFALQRTPQQPPTLTIKANLPPAPGKDAQGQAAAAGRQLQTLRSLLKGYRLSLQVRLVGKVTSTNAQHYAADTGIVTLLDVDADRLLADETTATALLQLGQDQLPTLAKQATPGLTLEDPSQPLTFRLE